MLDTGGAGLTLKEQDRLFDFLDVWDRTKPGMPVDGGHFLTLRRTFGSANAFRNALADDLDAAVNEAGWKKVVLTESDEQYEAYFRSVMDVVRGLVRETDPAEFMWWSGGSSPAPLDNRRETPMDGEVFKRFEAAVEEEHGQDACVLGLHVYSDSSQLSWSGGMFLAAGYSSFWYSLSGSEPIGT